MSMYAYQYDEDGFLLGPVLCDENPVRPGSWITPGMATLALPPLAPAGKRSRWTGTAWAIVPAPLGVPAPPPLTPEAALEAEREAMQPYARAFFSALTYFPAAGFDHMLDAYSQNVAATKLAAPYDDLVIWDQRVTIVLRAHPDMEVFRVAFNLDPLLLDVIFRTALLIEGGADHAQVLAFANAGIAELAP